MDYVGGNVTNLATSGEVQFNKKYRKDEICVNLKKNLPTCKPVCSKTGSHENDPDS